MPNIKQYNAKLDGDKVTKLLQERDMEFWSQLAPVLVDECTGKGQCKLCIDKDSDIAKLKLDIALLRRFNALNKNARVPMPDSDDIRILFPGVDDEFIDNVLTGMGVHLRRFKVQDLTEEQWRAACKKLGI
jgi:hypothetical protein